MAFIQIIHKFRDASLDENGKVFNTPLEKVAIFDEAQRAWNQKKLASFMEQKKGIGSFTQSEPECLIDIMDHHQDWAVIVCLIGGGQEIYSGEAGIQAWFDAIKDHFPHWEIHLSDQMTDSEYVGHHTISSLLGDHPYEVHTELHLGTSIRSFRSEKLSAFVKMLLDNKPSEAKMLYNEMKDYPLVVTRNLEKAKQWVRERTRGTERCGMLVSSEGKRLRAVGIWSPSNINHVSWFLNKAEHVDSSSFMEVAATEFQVQGLEIDYSLLAWDADFRYEDGTFSNYQFRGASWNSLHTVEAQRNQKNAYRVLLTRARQGMVIYLPHGVDVAEDPTRKREYYDGTYQYILSCGIVSLDE